MYTVYLRIFFVVDGPIFLDCFPSEKRFSEPKRCELGEKMMEFQQDIPEISAFFF